MLQMDDRVAQARSATVVINVQRVAFDAPWAWLAAGWRDLWSNPTISLLYGAIFAAVSAALMFGLMFANLASLILALAGGFLLIGPIAAVGLYEISRRLEAGERVRLGVLLPSRPRVLGQLAFFGAILTFVYLVWMQLAFLLLMLFLAAVATTAGERVCADAALHRARPRPVVDGHGRWRRLRRHRVRDFGDLGAAADDAEDRCRDGDIRRASLRCVPTPKPMMLWAALIAGFMALGLATLFAGLVVVFPLVGHATWHAYRDLVKERADSYL